MKYDVIKMYSNIDETIGRVNSCCKPGCSACCFQTIEILEVEKESIKNAIKTLDPDIATTVKKQLEKWLNIFDNQFKDFNEINAELIFGKLLNSGNHRVQCPLLINNLCSIYSLRPATCRMHFVEYLPELCEINRLRDSAKLGLEIRQDLMYYLMERGKNKLYILAFVLAEILLPKRKLKKIINPYF